MTAKQSKEMCGEHEAKIEYIIKRLDNYDAKIWAILLLIITLVVNAGWERLSRIPLYPVASAQASSSRSK